MNPLRECLRCERKLEQRKMIHTEGCWLCMDCFEHMKMAYPEEMAKEYNNEPLRCRGCE